MPPTPRILLNGLIFPEGPRWRDDKLWFSDICGARVMTAPRQITKAMGCRMVTANLDMPMIAVVLARIERYVISLRRVMVD